MLGKWSERGTDIEQKGFLRLYLIMRYYHGSSFVFGILKERIAIKEIRKQRLTTNPSSSTFFPYSTSSNFIPPLFSSIFLFTILFEFYNFYRLTLFDLLADILYIWLNIQLYYYPSGLASLKQSTKEFPSFHLFGEREGRFGTWDGEWWLALGKSFKECRAWCSTFTGDFLSFSSSRGHFNNDGLQKFPSLTSIIGWFLENKSLVSCDTVIRRCQYLKRLLFDLLVNFFEKDKCIQTRANQIICYAEDIDIFGRRKRDLGHQYLRAVQISRTP